MLTKNNATINPNISIKFFFGSVGKAVSLWTDWPLHGAEGAKRVRGVLKGPLATLRWLSPFSLLYILFALVCLLLPKCMSAHCANAAPEEGRDHLWDSVLSLSSDGS